MPIPSVTTTYHDNNLGMLASTPNTRKSIYLIGTSEDGPMHEPVYIQSLGRAKEIFGDISKGNLVRAVAELFDVPGNKRIYCIRIGDGRRSSLSLKEQTGYSGINTPTTTSVGDISTALSIEALYPGEIYNSTVIGYEVLEDYGTVLYFYNPVTTTKSYFKYSTDADDTSVTIHNVKDLEDAMNNDPNIAPWYRIAANTITASFECWVLPATSNTDYGTAGYGKSWNTLIHTDGVLPSEWSDGFSWDGYTAQFSLYDRIVGGSGEADDDAIEHPGNVPVGWEVLRDGMVSGTGPVKATETAVNNINSFNKFYTLAYTGQTYVDSITPDNRLDPMPYNTRGTRGYTVGAMNIYSYDGLQLKRPNTSPVNEIIPTEEDISTWASEYSLWFENQPINIGAGNNGYLNFGCFLPPDFSGFPRYWARQIFPTETTDPLSKILIGTPFKTQSYEATGLTVNESTMYSPHDAQQYKLDAQTSGVYDYWFGVTREGQRTIGTDEFLTLPPFALVKGSTITREYPYEDYAVAYDESDTTKAPSAYFPVPAALWTSSNAHQYSAYFLGPLSPSYIYRNLAYDYEGSTYGTITSKPLLVTHNGTDNRYDVSFAVGTDIDVSPSAAMTTDPNYLRHSVRMETDKYFPDTDLDSDEGLNPSARACVLPVEKGVISTYGGFEVDEVTGKSASALEITLDNGDTKTLGASDNGSLIVFANRIYQYFNTGVAELGPTPSYYGYVAPVDMDGAYVILVPDALNTANAYHYAEILAGDGDYQFYTENYADNSIPRFEYSLDGSNWEEVEPRWISGIFWEDNGQLYPNDNNATNRLKVFFVGCDSTQAPRDGDSYEYLGFENTMWSQWKALWESEKVTYPTLTTRYPNLDTFFVAADGTVPAMTSIIEAEFLAWANDTVPPFMEVDKDGEYLTVKSDAYFRYSLITNKGHLKQCYIRTTASNSNRSDYYFIYGNRVLFGSVPTTKLIFSYLTKQDYRENIDYVYDTNGIITFTNDEKLPFGNEYSAYKRFLIGLEYEYTPEWFDLSANRTLYGGTSGINVELADRYQELEDVLDLIEDFPPEILVPVDFYLDDIQEDYSVKTGTKYYRNAGLYSILDPWLEKVNRNSWTTRAVIPIKNPEDLTLAGIQEWVRKGSTVSVSDTLRAANVLAQVDNKFIDYFSYPMAFSSGGITFTVPGQCFYAGKLAVNALPTLPTNQSLSNGFRPLITMRKTLVDKLVTARVNTIIYNDGMRNPYVIADFVTGAAYGSDYSRGLNREMACEAVKHCREIWNEFKGKVQSSNLMKVFESKINNALNSIPAIKQVMIQIKQTEQMRVNGELNLIIDIIPLNEFRHLTIDLSFKRESE